MTNSTFIERLNEMLSEQSAAVVVGHNLHSVYLYHTHSQMRELYRAASIILPDGAPVLWDYKLSGGRSAAHRIGSTDWIPALGNVQGLERLLIVGASEDSNTKCVQRLKRVLPRTQVFGVPGAAWNDQSHNLLNAQCKSLDPQLVLVGLGMPLQEEVALSLLKSNTKSVIATVGGAIDQIAGVQRNAPRWLGMVGIEWIWRLLTQPRRLWRRYLVEPWLLVGLRLRQFGANRRTHS